MKFYEYIVLTVGLLLVLGVSKRITNKFPTKFLRNTSYYWRAIGIIILMVTGVSMAKAGQLSLAEVIPMECIFVLLLVWLKVRYDHLAE